MNDILLIMKIIACYNRTEINVHISGIVSVRNATNSPCSSIPFGMRLDRMGIGSRTGMGMGISSCILPQLE